MPAFTPVSEWLEEHKIFSGDLYTTWKRLVFSFMKSRFDDAQHDNLRTRVQQSDNAEPLTPALDAIDHCFVELGAAYALIFDDDSFLREAYHQTPELKGELYVSEDGNHIRVVSEPTIIEGYTHVPRNGFTLEEKATELVEKATHTEAKPLVSTLIQYMACHEGESSYVDIEVTDGNIQQIDLSLPPKEDHRLLQARVFLNLDQYAAQHKRQFGAFGFYKNGNGEEDYQPLLLLDREHMKHNIRKVVFGYDHHQRCAIVANGDDLCDFTDLKGSLGNIDTCISGLRHLILLDLGEKKISDMGRMSQYFSIFEKV